MMRIDTTKYKTKGTMVKNIKRTLLYLILLIISTYANSPIKYIAFIINILMLAFRMAVWVYCYIKPDFMIKMEQESK